jgi:hypothetical protein
MPPVFARPARTSAPRPSDRHVEEQVLQVLRSEGGPLAEARAADAELTQAVEAVNEAEHELDQFLANPKLLTILGETKFTEAVGRQAPPIDGRSRSCCAGASHSSRKRRRSRSVRNRQLPCIASVSDL